MTTNTKEVLNVLKECRKHLSGNADLFSLGALMDRLNNVIEALSAANAETEGESTAIGHCSSCLSPRACQHHGCAFVAANAAPEDKLNLSPDVRTAMSEWRELTGAAN